MRNKKMVREFVKNASKVAQKIDIMFEKAAYDNKTVAVHFSVGEKRICNNISYAVEPS